MLSCLTVMGLSYVEDIHLELHDHIPEGVHFVAEQPLSKASFSWREVGVSPLVLITYPVRVVSSRTHKGGEV